MQEEDATLLLWSLLVLSLITYHYKPLTVILSYRYTSAHNNNVSLSLIRSLVHEGFDLGNATRLTRLCFRRVSERERPQSETEIKGRAISNLKLKVKSGYLSIFKNKFQYNDSTYNLILSFNSMRLPILVSRIFSSSPLQS